MWHGARRVDVVDHRRERRALAAAGRPRDEHEAALFLRDALQHRRKPELVDRRIVRRDDAQDDADRAALLKHVAAEAAEARDAVREVHFLRLAELLEVVGENSTPAMASVSSRSRRLASDATTSTPLTRIIG